MRWTSSPETGGQLFVQVSSAATECRDTRPTLLDTHCHLDLLFRRDGGARCHTLADYKDRVGDFPNSFAGCIAVFEDPTRWFNSRWRTILDEPRVWGAIGCHPHYADHFNDDAYRFLSENGRLDEKIKAIGEIGLDYSRNNHVAHDTQKEAFARQLELAVDLGMPIVLHVREAEQDAYELIRRYVPTGQLLHRHCVTGDTEMHRMYIQEYPNYYVGFTSLITNPNAVNARQAVKELPLERMMLETDAPYFVPHPLRGRQRFAHPGMVEYVAKEIAVIKDLTMEEVGRQTTDNARRVYHLPL